MNILAIDTTMGFLGLALTRNGRSAANHYVKSGATLSVSIVATLEKLLNSAGMKPTELNLVAVNKGPGSFTGTRVGIAVAKTFSQVLAIPLIGIDSLHLLAAQTEPMKDVRFFAALNCVRHEVYFAEYEWQKEQIKACSNIKLATFEHFLEKTGGSPAILRRFESKHILSDTDAGRINPMPLRFECPDGLLLSSQALAIFESNPTGHFDPVVPLYIKSEVLR